MVPCFKNTQHEVPRQDIALLLPFSPSPWLTAVPIVLGLSALPYYYCDAAATVSRWYAAKARL